MLEIDDLSQDVKDALKSELPTAIRACEIAGNIELVLYAYNRALYLSDIKSIAEAALPNALRNAGKRADVSNLCHFYSSIPESMKSIAEEALIKGLTKAAGKTKLGNYSAFEIVMDLEDIPDFVKFVAFYILDKLGGQVQPIFDLLSKPNAPRQLKDMFKGLNSIPNILELVRTTVQARTDVKSVLDSKIKPPNRGERLQEVRRQTI